jgi:hypothetical protein
MHASRIHARSFRLLFVAMLLAMPLALDAAKPKKKVPASAPAPKVQPPPLLEIVARSDLKTTPEQRAAYAAELEKQAADAFYTLHPVKRVYEEHMEDGTAEYRLDIVHTGTLSAGNIQPPGYTMVDLVTKGGHIIREKAGYKTEWDFPVYETGSLRYRLLHWQGKEAGYKEVLAWQTPVKNTWMNTAMKALIVNTPLPSDVLLEGGETVITANTVPAMPPMSPAALAAAKKAAIESVTPVGTRDEIQTALCTCTLVSATAAKRAIGGRVVGPGTDAVRVRVTNKSPFPITEIHVDAYFISDGFYFRAMLEGGGIEPGKAETLELARPFNSAVPLRAGDRDNPLFRPRITVGSVKFDEP